MHLNVNDSQLINTPDRKGIRDALINLDVEGYAILERAEEVYVQTRRDDETSWCLEYRDGSEERHFGIDPETTTLDDVCKAFEAFFDGDDLAPLFDWEVIDFEDEDCQPGEGEVIYNGMIMDEEWPARIIEAQSITTLEIDGKPFERIRFGDERDLPVESMEHCGDCGVLKEQYHVPSCDIEQCPNCFGQVMSCGCVE
ncbi:hypothetical protein [Rhodopirellula sp. MGV]|uniref:hypothetical protein n=1 Tax=Rhodopirellula sp. MGV TaxID=2023130 RepID=UPI000B968C71|nr:hypothetical protein [Rhodopirellula sp. MGV]OYP38928.1 hypothetical protein CGZ80_01540 [Rhodopirellula sp. MGV]PNY37605.1 hypothetical protein C2E31_06505 [Rhodopirellula baltica]